MKRVLDGIAHRPEVRVFERKRAERFAEAERVRLRGAGEVRFERARRSRERRVRLRGRIGGEPAPGRRLGSRSRKSPPPSAPTTPTPTTPLEPPRLRGSSLPVAANLPVTTRAVAERSARASSSPAIAACARVASSSSASSSNRNSRDSHPPRPSSRVRAPGTDREGCGFGQTSEAPSSNSAALDAGNRRMFVSNALAMRDAISICVIGGVSVCPYASHTPSTRGGEDGGDGVENEGSEGSAKRDPRLFSASPASVFVASSASALTRRP